MYKISDEFEFQPGRTTDYGVLIESSSKLLVTRTGIKARLSSILG